MAFPPVLGLWLLVASRRGAARDAAPAGDGAAGPAARPVVSVPARPPGPLVWLHAGEGTEQAALDELVRRLRDARPEVTMLMTRADGGDAGKGAAARGRRARGVIGQPAPHDTLRVTAAFLDHWAPDLAVRTGLTLAPATMAALARRGTPVLMIDLHLPVRGARLVWRVPRLARALLRGVHHLLAADEASAQFLRRHGAPPERVEILGHLPDSTGALPCNEAERAALAARIGARPVWLALAPSAAELPLVLAAHRQAMRRSHRLLLILAPSGNPEDASALAEAQGFTVARQGADEDPEPATEVWVTEGIADRGMLYRLSPLTFLGQTIDPGEVTDATAVSGVSPYEPAGLGSAILHGARIGAYAAAYGKLMRAGATLPVRTATELAQAVEILQAPDRVAALAHAAWDVASSGAEVADRVIDLVVTALDAREVVA